MHETPSESRLALEAWMRQWPSIVTAYSGGVDSAVVAVAAHAALGARALACIGVSPSYPRRELRAAVALAERVGMSFRTVEPGEHLDPAYAANPADRCFHCKDHLFSTLARLAASEGVAVVLDGTHAGDLGDDRPGRLAAERHAVRSPLAELRIDKAGVRALAAEYDLPVWNKPAMACLASRVPHGTAISADVLGQVERAEDVLVAMGLTQFRVRHHGSLARIEVPAGDFARVLQVREPLVAGVRAAGYDHVTLDLAGFRSGGRVIPLVPERGAPSS